jgi:hypothetical protein
MAIFFADLVLGLERLKSGAKLKEAVLLSSTSLKRVIEVISAHLKSEGPSEAVAAQTLEAYQDQAKFV